MLLGIRGAVAVREDTKDAIHAAARELLAQLIEANRLKAASVASVFFTSTPDLTAAFPASVLRDIGWNHVPALCAKELDVAGGMAGIVRVLLLVNTDSTAKAKHMYLGKAGELRPDLVEKE